MNPGEAGRLSPSFNLCMTEFVRRILGARGIHHLATRYGWKNLRRLSFDAKYEKGDWVFTDENPDLVHLVEKYSGNGNILILGCGTAPIARALKPESFQFLLGVDLSVEAINLAKRHASEKTHFECGDMVKYRSGQSFDVILFPDSIYYAHWFLRKRLLRRWSKHLTTKGRIIISIAQPVRYAAILKMARRSFKVEVDRRLETTHGHVMVFR